MAAAPKVIVGIPRLGRFDFWEEIYFSLPYAVHDGVPFQTTNFPNDDCAVVRFNVKWVNCISSLYTCLMSWVTELPPDHLVLDPPGPFVAWVRYAVSIRETEDQKLLFRSEGFAKFDDSQPTIRIARHALTDDAVAHPFHRITVYVKIAHFLQKIEPVPYLPQRDEEARQFTEDPTCLFNDPESSDLKICVGETEFHVHKKTLRGISGVFRDLLPSDEVREIKVEGYDVNVVELLLRFIYTNHIDIPNRNVVEDILKAAKFYSVTDLDYLCRRYIMDEMDQNNILDILLFCAMNDEPDLLNVAKAYFRTHVRAYEVHEFARIEKENPQLLTDLLKIFLHINGYDCEILNEAPNYAEPFVVSFNEVGPTHRR